MTPEQADPNHVPWSGVIAVVNTPSDLYDDPRVFGDMTLRPGGAVIRGVVEDDGTHRWHAVFGHITKVWRDGNLIYGSGVVRASVVDVPGWPTGGVGLSGDQIAEFTIHD